MIIYLSALFFSVCFMYLSHINIKRYIPYNNIARDRVFFNQKIMVALSFLPLFLVAALRFEVGTDYSTYLMDYNNIILYNESRYEIGFTLLCKLIGKLTSNPQWFFVFTSFIILLFVYITIINYSPYKALSLLVLLEVIFILLH